jgi:hypothetical protein
MSEKKYVIRSSVYNTYVSDTDAWIADGWTKNINEAKVFDFDDAIAGLTAVTDHFYHRCWSSYGVAIHEVKEVTTLSLITRTLC